MKFISLVSFTFYCNVCLQCAKWNREYFVTARINTAGMGFALADRVLCNSYGEKNIRIDFFYFQWIKQLLYVPRGLPVCL